MLVCSDLSIFFFFNRWLNIDWKNVFLIVILLDLFICCINCCNGVYKVDKLEGIKIFLEVF